MLAERSVSSAAPAGGLDLHEELSTPAPFEVPGDDGRYRDTLRRGCARWPEGLALVSSHGEVVRGRCHATNLCDYCAILAAVENTEMLALDAMEGEAPEVIAILTTRTATLDMGVFYEGRRKVMRALKRRFPDVRYACLLEFTTGYGPRSGGKRRPHWNLLLKGVPASAVDVARDVIRRIWCQHVDADPAVQYVEPVRDNGGLMRYIALHFQKEAQRPPAGFRGQRFNCSRDYFTGKTRAEAREDARLALREKRELWKLQRHTGLEGDALEDAYEANLAAQGLPEWGVYGRKRPTVTSSDDPDVALPIVVAAGAWRRFVAETGVTALAGDHARSIVLLAYDTDVGEDGHG